MAKLVESLDSNYFEAASRMATPGIRTVVVYVEGYEDIAFWRRIFDGYESDTLKFEINVPARGDLAKGKKVVLQMADKAGDYLLLCVDSDFDYIFGDRTEQSRRINANHYVFQTFTYSIENYLCYPPSLHSVCVQATKNDKDIFDFVGFMEEYSRTVYPLFLWYAYSAWHKNINFFTLIDFRNSVRINYLDMDSNGEGTIAWLKRQVDKRLATLRHRHHKEADSMAEFERHIRQFGVAPEHTHLYMQGHVLMDNVVLIVLQAVCEQLRSMTMSTIQNSSRRGLPLKNEVSYYSNSLRDVREVLLDNSNFRDCFLYHKLKSALDGYANRMKGR